MKKTILAAIALIAIEAACNNSQNQNNASANSPYAAGKTVYQRTCIVCHQPDGTGMLGTYPPLANSDYLLADKNRAILQVLKGSSVPLEVDGKKYSAIMPPQSALKDEDVANVLTYVYHSFGNNGFTVTQADVKAVKDSLANADKNNPWFAGKTVYEAKCINCHQPDGSATLRTNCPPLAGSDYLLSDKTRAIKQTLNGTSEVIAVNGVKYSGSMQPQQLSNDEAAAVLNYISHSFGNNGYTVTPDEVKAVR